ncbi:MAG: hypothetical protein HY738_19915 [Bacteroidia bacterium]|nr:hypothetical protein [Bacteroidia bacterium]
MYVDSVMFALSIEAAVLAKTASLLVMQNAVVNGTVTIGNALTLNGQASSITSVSGTITFLNNNISTTGNIKANLLTANGLSDGTNMTNVTELRSHLDNAGIHAPLNDEAVTTTNLWSASKISSELIQTANPDTVVANAVKTNSLFSNSNLYIQSDAGHGSTFFNVANNNKVCIGTNMTLPVRLLVTGSHDSTASIGIARYSNDTKGPLFVMMKSRGSQLIPLAVAQGDELGRVVYGGYDGVKFVKSDVLRARATEDYSPAGCGSSLEFTVTPNGNTSPVVALLLEQDQTAIFSNTIFTPKLSIGVPSPQAPLDVQGDAIIRGWLYVEDGVVVGKRFQGGAAEVDTLRPAPESSQQAVIIRRAKSEKIVSDTLKSLDVEIEKAVIAEAIAVKMVAERITVDTIETQKMELEKLLADSITSQKVEAAQMVTDTMYSSKVQTDKIETTQEVKVGTEIVIDGTTGKIISNSLTAENFEANNLSISGSSNLSKVYSGRIVPPVGDSVIYFGDSTMTVNTSAHKISSTKNAGISIGWVATNFNPKNYYKALSIGTYAYAIGDNSIALGNNTFANGTNSLTLSTFASKANGNYSIAIGRNVHANAEGAIIIGSNQSMALKNNQSYSLMVGFNSEVPTFFVGSSDGGTTTGNVGIGTYENVNSKLCIKGSGNNNTSSSLQVTNSDNSSLLFVRNDGNVGIGIYQILNSKLCIKGSGNNNITSSLHVTNNDDSSLLFVRDDGSVGIGTTSPSEKLEITGAIKIGNTPSSNAGTIQWNSTIAHFQGYNGTSWVNLDEIGDNLGNHIATQNIRLNGKWLSNNGANAGIAINNSGSVGIGTNNPSAPLEILHSNDLPGATALKIKNNVTNVYTEAGLEFNISAPSVPSQTIARIYSKADGQGIPDLRLSFQIFAGQSNFIDVLNIKSNRIGIGTIDPCANLHVFENNINNKAIVAGDTSARSIWLMPHIDNYYNSIAVSGDVGIIFRNSTNNSGQNGFVIAPQSTSSLPPTGIRIAPDGNVGIGTTNPQALVHIMDGDLLLENNYYLKSKRNGNTSNLIGLSGSGAGCRIEIGEATSFPSEVRIFTPTDAGQGVSIHNGTYKIAFFRNDGNVGIGTTNIPTGFKLAVNGKIYCEKVKVVEDVGSDYVFEKDYPLMTIGELEAYIDTVQHLPDVPSAEEMKKNGLDLGDISIILLKKVEELTLYLIEQNKRIDELSSENDKLKLKMNEIINKR